MRKSLKALTAFILATLMIAGILSGCSNTDDVEPSQSPTTTPTSSADPVESTEPVEESGLIAEPGTEVTVWQSFSSTVITSYNDSSYVDYLEEETGVRIKFIESSPADAVVNFNLMLNTGEFPDIIRPGTVEYPGGGDKAIEDGVYMRLNDLIDEYIPNYAAIRAKGGNYEKLTISDSGNIWSIYSIKDPAEYAWMGLGIRKDLLDTHGLDLPVTIADWEEALTAFRDGGVTMPLILNSTGVMYDSEFLSAWNVGKDMYQVNGEVRYGYIQPEFEDYLKLMAGWYSSKLIDQDFIGKGVTMFTGGAGEASTQMNLGNVGAMLTSWGFSANRRAAASLTEIEDMWISAVKAPVLNEGDTVKFRFTNYEAASSNAISATCEDPILVAKLLNYLFSDEGSRMMNYGKEGISYTMVDGQPRYTDIILHDPEGLVQRDASLRHVWDDGIGKIDFKRLWQTFEESAPDALLAYDVWNSDGNEYVMPPVSLTDAEGKEYSAIMGDINTYVSENITSFIMGQKPISEFDSFVNQIKSMKIDEAIKIQQDALDRLNAR